MPALPVSTSSGGWPRPPSQDEQLALLRRAVNRRREIIDQGAFDEIVIRNQPLVISIAGRYVHKCRQLQLADLVNMGFFGLRTAILRFDERRSAALSTSATWWIRQVIVRGIEEEDATIRLPTHMHTRLRRSWSASEHLDGSFAHTSLPELVLVNPEPRNRPGMPPVDGSVLQNAQDTRDPLSLERPVATSLATEPSPLGDLLADERASFEDEVIERLDRQMMLDKVIGAAQLSLREGYIVAYRMGIAAQADGCAYTLEQVGEKLGVTRERVRQIEKQAMVKLRKAALLVGYGEEFGTALSRHEYTKVQTRVDVVRVKRRAKVAS